MKYNRVQFSAVQYSAVQYSAVQCSAVKYSRVQRGRLTAPNVLDTLHREEIPSSLTAPSHTNIDHSLRHQIPFQLFYIDIRISNIRPISEKFSTSGRCQLWLRLKRGKFGEFFELALARDSDFTANSNKSKHLNSYD